MGGGAGGGGVVDRVEIEKSGRRQEAIYPDGKNTAVYKFFPQCATEIKAFSQCTSTNIAFCTVHKEGIFIKGLHIERAFFEVHQLKVSFGIAQ